MRNPSPLRSLPAVHQVLEHPLLASLKSRVAHEYLVTEIQQRLEKHREALRQGGGATPDADALAAEVAAAVAAWFTPRLQPVINLTGTLLHTNLGRAPLSEAAVAAVASAAGTVNLEYDLDAGRRGDRDTLVEQLLCRLSGAEAATVVNNNAAAVYLALNTLAERKRVAVSRGELVEIGDSFRIPDIVKKSGCKLVEVGTTNRTHLKDYGQARRCCSRCTRATIACRASPTRCRSRNWSRWGASTMPPSSRIWAAARSWTCSAGGWRANPRCRNPSPPARTWSPSAATSCSAARRPG